MTHLKYFEKNGHAHFDGACFVFDARRALDPALLTRVDAIVPGQTGGLARPTAIRDALTGQALRE